MANHEAELPPPRRSYLTFSLSTLMMLTLLVSVYMAGRYAAVDHPSFAGVLSGQWQARLPQGAVQPTTLTHVEGDTFMLSSRAMVFSGQYQWKGDQLAVVKPNDKRMMGLIWEWDGEQLELVAEPGGTPTGSSYLGTVLVRAPATAIAPAGAKPASEP